MPQVAPPQLAMKKRGHLVPTPCIVLLDRDGSARSRRVRALFAGRTEVRPRQHAHCWRWRRSSLLARLAAPRGEADWSRRRRQLPSLRGAIAFTDRGPIERAPQSADTARPPRFRVTRDVVPLAETPSNGTGSSANKRHLAVAARRKNNVPATPHPWSRFAGARGRRQNSRCTHGEQGRFHEE